MHKTNTTDSLPTIVLSTSASTELRRAIADSGDCVQLHVDSSFTAKLDIVAPQANLTQMDIDGIVFLLDGQTLLRCDGISIDYRNGNCAGFTIDNPNAPAKVVEIDAHELKARLDSGEFVQFFDVRTIQERELALISGTRLLDDAAVTHIESLDRKTPLVFH